MRPLILVTNDDGVFSPGLAAAAEAVRDLGDLLIVAPRRQQTTMGRSFPRTIGAGIIKTVRIRLQGTLVEAYGVVGSPAQAVAHAVLELAGRLPDLCISGINYGENLGPSLTCSGTVGAALEAGSHGIPGLAVSLATPLHLQHAEDYPVQSWVAAQRVTGLLAARILDQGLPASTCLLNVNVPDSADATTGIRITRQSRLSHSIFSRPEARGFDHGLLLRTELNPRLLEAEPGSDIQALCFDKVISVTPISWDMSVNAVMDFKL
jgi:5'-nucleotidase